MSWGMEAPGRELSAARLSAPGLAGSECISLSPREYSPGMTQCVRLPPARRSGEPAQPPAFSTTFPLPASLCEKLAAPQLCDLPPGLGQARCPAGCQVANRSVHPVVALLHDNCMRRKLHSQPSQRTSHLCPYANSAQVLYSEVKSSIF